MIFLTIDSFKSFTLRFFLLCSSQFQKILATEIHINLILFNKYFSSFFPSFFFLVNEIYYRCLCRRFTHELFEIFHSRENYMENLQENSLDTNTSARWGKYVRIQYVHEGNESGSRAMEPTKSW